MEKPPEKHLQVAPFTVHVTRGLLRDASSRRKAMTVSLVIAIMLLVVGSTVLRSSLDPHAHPARFIVFWFACGWITLTALFLAVFHILQMRVEARRARQALRDEVSTNSELKPE